MPKYKLLIHAEIEFTFTLTKSYLCLYDQNGLTLTNYAYFDQIGLTYAQIEVGKVYYPTQNSYSAPTALGTIWSNGGCRIQNVY